MTLQDKEKALEPLMEIIDELDPIEQELIKAYIRGMKASKNIIDLKNAS